MQLNALERRIVDLSFKHKLTHISSCLNTVNVLDAIYENRKQDEPVILGAGHAGLALYVVLEAGGLCDAEEMLDCHGIHPCRDMDNGVWCSSGSLGQAETVAVGMALGMPKKKVWLVTSDGACAEGSVHEAMRMAYNLTNLYVFVIYNGFGAYGRVPEWHIPLNVTVEKVKMSRYPKWLRGQDGHYLTLTNEQYLELMQ